MEREAGFKLALRDHLMANFQLTDKKIILFELLRLYKKTIKILYNRK